MSPPSGPRDAVQQQPRSDGRATLQRTATRYSIRLRPMPCRRFRRRGRHRARSYNEILEDAGDFNATGSLQGGSPQPDLLAGHLRWRRPDPEVYRSRMGYLRPDGAAAPTCRNRDIPVSDPSQSGTSLQSGNVTLLENQLQAAQHATTPASVPPRRSRKSQPRSLKHAPASSRPRAT